MSRISDSLDEDITIIKEFIRDKVEKAGADGVVLGLSGGLDSSTTLKFAIDALGEDKVHALILPESASPDSDMRDARWLADKWSIEWDEMDIDKILEVFPGEEEHRMAYANLKARVRMCIEYYFANVESRLVIGTSNKSELLLGYTTKYGDSAADFLPLGDVYKSDLREMAKKIGVPDRFLDKVPRAGLWEDQTDEDEIGYSYDGIDKILKSFEDREDLDEIAAKNGVDLEEVEDIKSMVESSAHKRSIPSIIKLRSATVGKDWREFAH